MKSVRAFLLVLVACGGHGSSDLMPDSGPPPTPPTGPVELHVTRDGEPVAGVRVIFQDLGSNLVGDLTTNNAGVATAEMSGGFVTVIDPFGPPAAGAPTDVRTFAGVARGDILTLVDDTRAIARTVTVAGPLDPGATRYQLHTSCGSGPLVVAGTPSRPRGQLTLTNCGTHADMLLVSTDPAGRPLRALLARDLPIDDGASLELVGTYEQASTIELNFRAASLVHVRNALATPRGRLIEATTDATPDPMTFLASAMIRMPAPAAATMLTDARLEPFDGELAVHGALAWGPAVTSRSIDLVDHLPEIISSPTFVRPRSIQWSEHFSTNVQLAIDAPSQQPEVPPDVVIAEALVTRANPPLAWRWRVAQQHTGSFVAAPNLPPSADTFNVLPADTVTVTSLTIMQVTGGYHAVRERALTSSAPEHFVTDPLGGLVVYQHFPR